MSKVYLSVVAPCYDEMANLQKGVLDKVEHFLSKMFRHDVTKKLFTKINNLHSNVKKVSSSSVSARFDVELLYLAQKMGYKIKEVPVEWLYVERRRVNPVKDSVEGFLDLVRIKINDLRGVY